MEVVGVVFGRGGGKLVGIMLGGGGGLLGGMGVGLGGGGGVNVWLGWWVYVFFKQECIVL